MKRLVFLLLLLSSSPILESHAQVPEKTLSINTSGSYLFNYAGYSFDDPYSHWSLALSFDKMKQKNGFQISALLSSNYVRPDFSDIYPALSQRVGLHICINYIRNIKSWKNIKLNVFGGLATKYSEQNITMFVLDKGSFSEAVKDPNAFEFGGLATNIGINGKYALRKRLFLNASVRSINFLAWADYQTHGIYTELGLGWRLGKLK